MTKHAVVIGGGVVGLTTAWALLERGHALTLVEREPTLASQTSFANGGQLSYRYVSPLADAGVPLKALGWLLDADGPLRLRPEARWQQWSWLARFLWACRGSVNRRMTARLLALGAYSQQRFDALVATTGLGGFELRDPGKLVFYRRAAEFARVAARLPGGGPERALSGTECIALEPALTELGHGVAGGIFTEGEAVADCRLFCEQLAARVQAHDLFRGLVRAQARSFVRRGGAVAALALEGGDEIAADHVVIAAGLHSRALARAAGITLPIYPLKGYSLSAPIEASHRPPEVSVTDFERKVLYARIGDQLRVAAMVDLVGEDLSIDPDRIASLQRNVRATMPAAADYARATPWAGLRPATPSGAPIVGATPWPGLWINAGHGALGFTFAAGTAGIVADLIDGRPPALALDGLAPAA